MKVLVDTRIWGATGVQEYAHHLLKSLLAIDKKNEYFFFYNSFQPKSPLLLKDNQNPANVINWRVPNKLLDLSSKFFNFPQIDRFLKTDLVFSPHFNILSVGNKPRIITFHDLSFLHHPDFFSWRQKIWHWLQDVKKQAQQAEKIIAVSEFTKSDLVNFFGISPEKISVIYSGISEEFKPLLNIQNQPAKVPSKPFILYLGTLEPRKNISAIIKAFNILKKNSDFSDLQLVIAGKPGWLYQNILDESKGSPYSADIIFKGSVSSEERVLLYNLAKVFVYPSFFEGFGFPPLEAQACGCPAVVSDRTSLPEVIGKSALLVDPWKVEELAQSIEQAISNKRVRARLIKAGYANTKKFNWQKTAEQTLKLISDI